MNKNITVLLTTVGFVLLIISLVACKGKLQWIGLGLSMLVLLIAVLKQTRIK